ncbi:MAG: hypothetical protein NVSMB56_00520 [Pyrinomonadaceae bacterium]
MNSRRFKTWHFWSLLMLLIAGGTMVNVWERAGELTPPRHSLQSFPTVVGNWRQQGGDVRFDAGTESVLRADDYLARDYISMADGNNVSSREPLKSATVDTHAAAIASLYVGYYASQRSGATYHSPLNCLPGAGWTMDARQMITITPASKDGAQQPASSFEANRYVIQNGDERQLLVYWYQGRGRTLANEYWGKIYTALDSVKRRRSDGAMVRVLIPIGDKSGARDEQTAERLAVDLAVHVAPFLPEFVPD